MVDYGQIQQIWHDAMVRHGIDPRVGMKMISGAEWGPNQPWQSKLKNKDGTQEVSYGPWQFNMNPGAMGDRFVKATGLNPANQDEQTVRAMADFAAQHAATHGWGEWFGMKRVGVGPRDGIGTAQPVSASPQTQTPGARATTNPLTGTPQPDYSMLPSGSAAAAGNPLMRLGAINPQYAPAPQLPTRYVMGLPSRDRQDPGQPIPIPIQKPDMNPLIAGAPDMGGGKDQSRVPGSDAPVANAANAPGTPQGQGSGPAGMTTGDKVAQAFANAAASPGMGWYPWVGAAMLGGEVLGKLAAKTKALDGLKISNADSIPVSSYGYSGSIPNGYNPFMAPPMGMTPMQLAQLAQLQGTNNSSGSGQ